MLLVKDVGLRTIVSHVNMYLMIELNNMTIVYLLNEKDVTLTLMKLITEQNIVYEDVSMKFSKFSDIDRLND